MPGRLFLSHFWVLFIRGGPLCSITYSLGLVSGPPVVEPSITWSRWLRPELLTMVVFWVSRHLQTPQGHREPAGLLVLTFLGLKEPHVTGEPPSALVCPGAAPKTGLSWMAFKTCPPLLACFLCTYGKLHPGGGHRALGGRKAGDTLYIPLRVSGCDPGPPLQLGPNSPCNRE